MKTAVNLDTLISLSRNNHNSGSNRFKPYPHQLYIVLDTSFVDSDIRYPSAVFTLMTLVSCLVTQVRRIAHQLLLTDLTFQQNQRNHVILLSANIIKPPVFRHRTHFIPIIDSCHNLIQQLAGSMVFTIRFPISDSHNGQSFQMCPHREISSFMYSNIIQVRETAIRTQHIHVACYSFSVKIRFQMG